MFETLSLPCFANPILVAAGNDLRIIRYPIVLCLACVPDAISNQQRYTELGCAEVLAKQMRIVGTEREFTQRERVYSKWESLLNVREFTQSVSARWDLSAYAPHSPCIRPPNAIKTIVERKDLFLFCIWALRVMLYTSSRLIAESILTKFGKQVVYIMNSDMWYFYSGKNVIFGKCKKNREAQLVIITLLLLTREGHYS